MAWVAADGRVVSMVVETIIKPEEIHKPEKYDPSSIKGGHTFGPDGGRLQPGRVDMDTQAVAE
jgi:hypothetical protein